MNKCDCNKPKCGPSKCQKDGFVFRKVVIPAQLGDDVTGKEKPENGAMTNSFVTYAANGAQYIYDSFGVYTKFTGENEVPVLSVNGKTGRVVLTTSDLENDSDYVTASYVAEAIGTEMAERKAADIELAKPMVGATSSTDGKKGMVPAPLAGDEEKALMGDGTWKEVSSQTIFYSNSAETGGTRHIYKNATFSEAASAQDILDANEDGQVILRMTINPNPEGLLNDAYLQNTYVGIGDYQFLFLDNSHYYEYDSTTASATSFTYSVSEIQQKLTAGTNISISGNTISASIPIDTEYNATSGNPVANSTITNSLNRSVVTDVALSANPSTTTVNVDETTTNLTDPAHPTTTVLSLPVASTTQAGVMNKATFDAVAKNTQDIANIKGEVVAITGLPANPTQAELTAAWKTASGETELINGAGIYDTTNEKRWTYYANDDTWHWLDANASIHVQQWTNSAAGIAKGSTVTGQIYAESDGTGSVNGWDTLTGQVSTNTSKLATIASGAEVNVQSDLDITDSTSDAFVKNQFVKRYRTGNTQADWVPGWVYLGTLEQNNGTTNRWSIEVSGRVGGYYADTQTATIDLVLGNRNKATAVGSIVAPSDFSSRFDIVAYQDTNATTGQATRWYLKEADNYNSVDIEVRYTLGVSGQWDFTKTTTEPSGVKVYSLAEDIANGGTKVSWYNTNTGNINSMNTVPTSTVGSQTQPAYVSNGTITPVKQRATGANWNIVPFVGSDGVMEVGKYIDFHVTDAGTEDNTARMEVLSNGSIKNDSGDFVSRNGYSVENNGSSISSINTELDSAAFVDSTIGTLSNLAYVGTTNIQDGAVTTAKIANLNVTDAKLASNSVTTAKIADDAVTSDKIDWTTVEYPNQSAIIIGTYVDAQNNTHNLYKRYVQIGDLSIPANGGYIEKNLNLQSYTIMHTSGILYRSDVATVMSILPGGEFGMVWTNSGQTLRIVNNLSVAQTNATLQLELVYRD